MIFLQTTRRETRNQIISSSNQLLKQVIYSVFNWKKVIYKLWPHKVSQETAKEIKSSILITSAEWKASYNGKHWNLNCSNVYLCHSWQRLLRSGEKSSEVPTGEQDVLRLHYLDVWCCAYSTYFREQVPQSGAGVRLLYFTWPNLTNCRAALRSEHQDACNSHLLYAVLIIYMQAYSQAISPCLTIPLSSAWSLVFLNLEQTVLK